MCYGHTPHTTLKDLSNLYITSYIIFWKFSIYSMNLKALRIVGLERAAHTIQLGVFPSIREVRTNPYHMIFVKVYGRLPIVKPSHKVRCMPLIS